MEHEIKVEIGQVWRLRDFGERSGLDRRVIAVKDGVATLGWADGPEGLPSHLSAETLLLFGWRLISSPAPSTGKEVMPHTALASADTSAPLAHGLGAALPAPSTEAEIVAGIADTYDAVFVKTKADPLPAPLPAPRVHTPLEVAERMRIVSGWSPW